MSSSSTKLGIEGLGKAFRGSGGESVVALRDVDLTVGDGEFVSIVGPSGCGKSTLFNIVAGLEKPSSGRVLLDGAQLEDLLGEVGYMPQRDLLMPWRTVLDNTTLGLELNGMKKSEARRIAEAEFPRFGLDGFEDQWPGDGFDYRAHVAAGPAEGAGVVAAALARSLPLAQQDVYVAGPAAFAEAAGAALAAVGARPERTFVLALR